MAEDYQVKQGDYIGKIARDKGFTDYKVIWNHPQNSELKKKRKTPNILMPGDILYIPDRETKEESKSVNSKHTFKLKTEKLKLALIIKDMTGKPVAGKSCEFKVAGGPDVPKLSTDGDGMVSREIPADAKFGTFYLKDGNLPINLDLELYIGFLDPVYSVTGQKARLNNLGYNAGPVNNEDTLAFRSAVEEFQCDQGIQPVTGICNSATQSKLEKEYGC